MTFADRFLRYPDLFPARLAGDPWGEESFIVDLPGGPYSVTGLASAQREAMIGRYGDSADDSVQRPGAIRIQVFTSDPDDFLSMGPPGWDYTLGIDCSAAFLRIAAPNFMARIERGSDGAGAVWTPHGATHDFINVIENVLRPLVALRLLEAGGLLLHSSGVVIGERSFLFIGQSGAGKSTVAELALARGHKVLSDDLNVLEQDAAGWFSHRLPFAGSHQGEADPSRYPVAAIIRLRQAAEHRVEPMSAADAFSLLYSAAPFVNGIDPLAAQLEARILGIVESLPRWTLHFRKDSGLWDIIETL